MKIIDKIFLAILPTAIQLFFKCFKQIAEIKWHLVFPDDHLIVEPARREIIPSMGKIKLFRASPWLEKWFSVGPLRTAYHDGQRDYMIFPRDEFWECHEIKPFKAEHDAWLAQRKQKNRQQEALEEREATPTPTLHPPVKSSLTFKVAPRKDSDRRTNAE